MSSSGELIHVHIGQAGVQIANACWELYCLEHGIDATGTMYGSAEDQSYKTFFAYSNSCKFVPRLIMVDSEPTVIDEVRTGCYGNLYKPETLITGMEDSGSNFARGYNTVGNELAQLTMNAIRRVAEGCHNLKGFLTFRSVGGGTGSGFGNRILEEITNQYSKLTRIEISICPSPGVSCLTVEPYNTILASHLGMDTADCSFIIDNEALYNICENRLDVNSPTFTNINRIIGQAMSALSASQRFFGSTNVSFTEFETNLVPYPRIHFPLMSLSPMVTMCTSSFVDLSTEQLTIEAFDPLNQFVHVDPTDGKFMSCVLLYRGNVSPSDINCSINNIRADGHIQFVSWTPTGFKVGINSMPPMSVPGSDMGPSDKAVLALMNNTNVRKAWCRLHKKFSDLYKRRAFIHHFAAEGMDEDMFGEASEDICSLITDYMEVEGVQGAEEGSKDSDTRVLSKSSHPQVSQGPA